MSSLSIETEKVRVFIIEERANPSTDFFVLPQFQSAEFKVTRCTFNELVSPVELQNAVVVFVRYLPKAWRTLVSDNRAVLKSLYYFMDDDLLDFKASRGVPFRYRWKLTRLATLPKSWLTEQGAELWVSTPFLAKKYQAWSPVMIEPKPLNFSKRNLTSATGEIAPKYVKVFYHGSASHQAEIDWLYPIIQTVLKQSSNICFEIIGTHKVYKQFKGLERVHVVHPMSWPAYQCFIQQPGRHIGLAPLLPSAFNQARSHTKVFDITQAGAVGIYSEGSESARYVQSMAETNVASSLGVVLPLEPERWAAEILGLAKQISKTN